MQCSYGLSACFLFTQLGSNTGLLGASSSYYCNCFCTVYCCRDWLKNHRFSYSQTEKQGWTNVSLQIRVFLIVYSARIWLLFMVMLICRDCTSSCCFFPIITYFKGGKMTYIDSNMFVICFHQMSVIRPWHCSDLQGLHPHRGPFVIDVKERGPLTFTSAFAVFSFLMRTVEGSKITTYSFLLQNTFPWIS